MGYVFQELIAFIAIEGDHFDALVKSPDLYTSMIGDRVVIDEDSTYADPATFEDLVLTSAGEEATGMYLIGVSGGWTFLATPFDVPQVEFGYMMRLARQFGKRAFQIDFSSQYAGGAFIICNDAGEVIRYVSRTEFTQRSECSVLGKPLPEEAEMADLWEVNDVMKMFNALGMPDFVTMANWYTPFDKSAWFEPSREKLPQIERDLLKNLTKPVWEAVHQTTANDPAAFINFVSDEDIEAENKQQKAAYYEKNRGGILAFRALLAVLLAAIAVAIWLLFF